MFLQDTTQYQGSVGIFNNGNYVFRPEFINFIGHNCWSTNQFYFKLHFPIFPMNLVLLLAFVIVVLSTRCSFYITSRNSCTSVLVITVALLFDYVEFICNLQLCAVYMEFTVAMWWCWTQSRTQSQYCKKNFYLPLEP